jgi:hypothetical protein
MWISYQTTFHRKIWGSPGHIIVNSFCICWTNLLEFFRIRVMDNRNPTWNLSSCRKKLFLLVV